MCPSAATVRSKELRQAPAVTPASSLIKAPVGTSGSVVFEGVRMRYRPDANLALDGVNLTIRHGEKVGIVGRTGSGKSTLLLALFRLFDLAV